MLTESNKKKRLRNSNIELLRIIAMLFIIMGHFNGQSGFCDFSLSINNIIVMILGSGQRIAVNIFLIIGCWFMIDSKFSGERIIRLYSQVFFYSFILTTVMIFLGNNISIKDTARGYFPFFGRSLWFASAYLTLVLMAPFLNYFLQMAKKQLKLMLIIMFCSICIVSTFPDLQQAYLCDSLWFWFVYLLIGYAKKHVYIEHFSAIAKYRKILFLSGVVLYTLLCLGLFFGSCFENKSIVFVVLKRLCQQYLGDIKTFPNLICALMVFLFVLFGKKRSNSIVQKLSSVSFSVYIFHQVPLFISFLWLNIYNSAQCKKMDCSFAYCLFVAFSLYLIVFIIDMLVRKPIEKIWVKTKMFCIISGKINQIYSKTGFK